MKNRKAILDRGHRHRHRHRRRRRRHHRRCSRRCRRRRLTTITKEGSRERETGFRHSVSPSYFQSIFA